MKSVCDGLKLSSKKLEIIDFSNCDLSDECGLHLAELINVCSKLKTLIISFNSTLNMSLNKILNNMIKLKLCLNELQLIGCPMNESRLILLGKLLEESSELRILSISGNKYLKDLLKPIKISLLQSKYSLKKLTLENFFENDFIPYDLLNFFSLFTSLETVDLGQIFHLDWTKQLDIEDYLIHYFLIEN